MLFLMYMTLVSTAIFNDGIEYPQRKTEHIKYLVIHRLDVGSTPEAIYKAFADGKPYAAGSYTGQKLPYHFFLPKNPEGQIYQLHPLLDIAPHAKSFNQEGIGIAVEGDMTKGPATAVQYDTLVKLCAYLIELYGDLKIVGHTDLPNSTNTPGKICPGKYLNIERLRQAVQLHLRTLYQEATNRKTIVPSLIKKPEPPWKVNA